MNKTKLKILAVDDEQDNLAVLRTMLEQAFPGAVFLGASGGGEGLELARAEDPDMLILDIVMPAPDGFETCRRLKADPELRHIPVVFVTAYSTDKLNRAKALEAGGDGFLAKPLEEAELKAQVRAMARLKAAAVAGREEKARLETMIEKRTRELREEVLERRRSEELVKTSLAEKEALLKEIHHRVKNNLQVVSSLLNLEAKQVKDAAALEAFRDSRRRIKAMALVHEVLYRSKHFSGIEMSRYIDTLLASLLEAYGAEGRVKLEREVCDCRLGVDQASVLGLILNELVSNSLKHAFAGGRGGRLRVSFKSDGPERVLEVADDGPGLPEGLDLREPKTLGLQLVSTLARQLSGYFEAAPGEGSRMRVRFRQ